jgi:hypothetical protein
MFIQKNVVTFMNKNNEINECYYIQGTSFTPKEEKIIDICPQSHKTLYVK